MAMHLPVSTLVVALLLSALAVMALAERAAGGGPIWPQPSYRLLDVDQAPPGPDAAGRDQGVWAKAPPAGPFLSRGVPESEGGRTDVRMLTSKGVLYVAARCRGAGEAAKQAPTVAVPDPRPAIFEPDAKDSLQLLFALGGKETYPLLEVQADATGACRAFREPVPQSMWRTVLPEVLDPSPVKATVKADRQGWSAVVELPMAALGIPAEGFRMNIVRNRPAPPATTAPAAGTEPPPNRVQFAWGDLWAGPVRNPFR